MTSRFRVLDELEREFVELASRTGAADGRRHRSRWQTRRPAGVLSAGAAFLMLATTVTLAATGTILTGSPVPAPAPANPEAGIGIPAESRLLAVRVPDSAGGLPWGMRAVRTTRGLECVQIGRVKDGQLGELGVNGAFHNDGLFHAVSADIVPSFPGATVQDGAVTQRGTCVIASGSSGVSGQTAGSAVAAEFWGTNENGAFEGGGTATSADEERDISYGLLGPSALSVTYGSGSSARTIPVEAGVGAYLVVQPAQPVAGRHGSGEAPGTQIPGEGPGTAGALTSITYRQDGAQCESGYNARTGANVAVKHPCVPVVAQSASAKLQSPPRLTNQLKFTFSVDHGAVVAADITFPAPLAISSASTGYMLELKGCEGESDGLTFEHNVAEGAIVHMRLPYPFAGRCAGRPVTVNVILRSTAPHAAHTLGQTPGQLVLGSLRLHLPNGTRAGSPPRRRTGGH